MNNVYSGLAKALAVSLALHAALIAAGLRVGAPIKPTLRPAQAELRVSLREQLVVPDAAVAPARLMLPPEPQQNASATVAVRTVATSTVRTRNAAPQPLQGAAALKPAAQLQRELYYPVEAIE